MFLLITYESQYYELLSHTYKYLLAIKTHDVEVPYEYARKGFMENLVIIFRNHS